MISHPKMFSTPTPRSPGRFVFPWADPDSTKDNVVVLCGHQAHTKKQARSVQAFSHNTPLFKKVENVNVINVRNVTKILKKRKNVEKNDSC